MKYIDHLPSHVLVNEIESVHRDRQRWVSQQKKGFLRFRNPCEKLQQFKGGTIDCASDTVTIGCREEISDADHQIILDQLRAFMPWRKGPFSIYGIEIDAEWRSERKWQRLEPFLPDLDGKIVADIGCSNGYYMFRMTPSNPRFVIGFEPAVQPYFCFKALNGMAGFENLDVDLLGVEHITLFPETFDLIFLMGVIYHRPSPVEVLKDILDSLRPGGTLILESQALPGSDPVALFPEKTYAKVPGTYFVPTGICLKNWLIRAGFEDVTLCCSHPMSSHEQRKTDWMVFESYSDFIAPDNSDQTIEGYPAPWRVFLKAVKKTRN